MAMTRLFLFWFCLLLPWPSLSQLDFAFPRGFRAASTSLTFHGAAGVTEHGILRLTDDSPRVLGHTFYSSPVRIRNASDGKVSSFSTCFAFATVPQYPKLGGHGLAFTISRMPNLSGALPSQYLGLMNASNIGNSTNHVFAIEFDTVQDFEFGDIDDNHVGVDINSLVSNASAPAVYYDQNSRRVRIYMKSGIVIQAWVDYDSMSSRLDVRLSPSSSKPSLPILSFTVDLSPVFDDLMYVGFSASTGLLASYHYLLGWSFSTIREAQSLSLSSLPSLPGLKHHNLPLIIGVSALAVMLLVGITVTTVHITLKIKNADVIEAWEHDVGPHRFCYGELKKATKSFRDTELLGFGGFGRVYKGVLLNTNTEVAVKRISHESKQGMREFISEIVSNGRLCHRNLVQLLGWCRHRSDLLLVYDFMPNGSLDKFIFDEPKVVLSWDQRFKIVKDIASGILYLHEEWDRVVIHRDIKAGNVLLDAELNGRLGDFGLAKLYERGSNPSTTRVVGTLGYLAPELTRAGRPTTSSDVFAFGALLLEVVCGRRPIEPKALPEELVLVDWVWETWVSGTIFDVVDSRLGGEYNELEVVIVLKLGLMCSNNSPELRPTMRQVTGYLDGDLPLPAEVAAPVANDEKAVTGKKLQNLDVYVHSYPSSFVLSR
ncbi:hypothetical protein MLD38_038150 [Melastoma candidum]|uniref:Uncharacterized protein n=1 Tax=Melastoma candidum TaxID=119954 RepID=A0ACB9KYZ7_9MYRT|nr:hypothetical protein MLD38_038150 [Melastoma candidum]